MSTTKVLVVDDSALMRRFLSEILDRDPALHVVATANDPIIAREKIRRLNPDVLTLDVEMPRMDGLTFLKNLMRLRPMPVVMVSSLTAAGADVTLKALEIGAVDFVTKPKILSSAELAAQAEIIVSKVKAAAHARLLTSDLDSPPPPPPSSRIDDARAYAIRTDTQVLAIGASTGGTEAIKDVLLRVGPSAPIIVVVQHIPPMFSASFARRLDALCAISVAEAKDGTVLEPGHAYVAPGDAHLTVERSGRKFIGKLSYEPAVNRHRPSVDVLFTSVARAAGRHSLGILLTGMGSDGAQGLLKMKNAGAATIAQDEASSVVWGMPKEAGKLGAAREVLSLPHISARLGAAYAIEVDGHSMVSNVHR
ncbi:MAG: chemotaxis response regulator protein-glutamate methylesterase [Myxococcota bacterium]